MGKKVDVIFVSKRRNFLYNTKISLNLFAVVSLIILCVIVATALLSFSNAKAFLVGINIRKCEQEHRILVSELDSLFVLLRNVHSDFENHIARDKRERTFWQLAHIHPDIWSMGIGGADINMNNGVLSVHTNRVLNDIYKSIDVLKGKCYLRETSLRDIERQMENNLYLWAHIPSINPVPGKTVGSGFGYRVDPINKKIRMHWGVDIGASRGTSIHATADGIVTYVGWNKGYGLTVDIDHGFGFRTRYAHCHNILVKKGDVVKRDQIIATVGSTGRTIAPHLHYEVHISGVKVNPKPYIDLSSVVVD